MESLHSLRYSELLRLSYFDPIRGHAVDPMHNLFLGTAKHVFSVWIQLRILNEDKVKAIDNFMKELVVSSKIGRITKSILLYKTMKLDEWKNVFGKLSVAKGIQKFDRINLGNRMRRKVFVSDTVYFIIS